MPLSGCWSCWTRWTRCTSRRLQRGSTRQARRRASSAGAPRRTPRNESPGSGVDAPNNREVGVMIKVISMWNYSSIVSRDAAEAHYHDVHIPLAMRLFNDLPGVLGYVQKRVGPSLTRDVVTGEPRGTPPPFEWLIELELRSLDTLGELSRHALIE